MAKWNTKARLDQILPEIQKPGFLENRGRSNEIGFYIFDYPPQDELLVRDHIQFILKQIQSPSSKIPTVEIDLYDLILEILENRRVLEKIPANELSSGYSKVIDSLRKGVLKPENFVKIIESKIENETKLVLLTGVGKAYPLLRSHTVLNNLHHSLGHLTVLMFFPGTYDQRELQLFGKFRDDNYYRAFRLVEDK